MRAAATPNGSSSTPIAASPSPIRPSGPPAPSADTTRTRVPVRTADFDPGVLDRLADDVIRRVERRVRIERERRGL
jgi:hypothetical protein